jgi:hypothetical protein
MRAIEGAVGWVRNRLRHGERSSSEAESVLASIGDPARAAAARVEIVEAVDEPRWIDSASLTIRH